MNITHYIAILDNDYVAKNKLQKAVLQYLKSIDRKLIEKSQIGLFQKSILHSFDKINEENNRCKAVKIRFENGYPNKEDILVRDTTVANFSIRACEASHVPILFYKSPTNN